MRSLPSPLSVRFGTLTPSVMICAAETTASIVPSVTINGGTLR